MERGRGRQTRAPASAVPGAGMGSAPVGQPGFPGQAPLCAAGNAAHPQTTHTAWPTAASSSSSSSGQAERAAGSRVTAGDRWGHLGGGAGRAALLAVIKADEL